ncbi:MAG TPA: hypothetical protein VJ694_01825 [Patescibacteria group bacterium]|nr:hypothetical protein [Patescibacteria group bacterium]
MCPFPPLTKEWMDGKTQATVRFVLEAEHALSTGRPISADEGAMLRSTIERMKIGQESLETFEAVDDWLERLRDHHP